MKYLLTGFLLFFSVNSWAAWTEYDRSSDGDVLVTLSTVTARVRNIVDDPTSPSGTVRYSSATIYNLINTGHRLFVITTQALTAWATQQLLADTTEYILPDNCLFLERVTVNIHDGTGESYIPQKTVFGLDLETDQWAISESSQAPTSYYIRNRYIGVHPVPDNSGATIKIWYIKMPSLMTAESDVIFDNYTQLEPYWEALANYAAYHIFLQEGDVSRAASYSNSWTQMIGLCMGVLRHSPDYNVNFTGTVFKDTQR